VVLPEAAGEVSAALFAYLLSRRREWSILELQQQDAGSTLFPPPAGVDLRGYLVRQWPGLEHCSIPLQWNSLRGYVAALSRNFRTNLRRQMRKLLAAGDVQLLGSSDPAATPALLELYLGIELHSWKAQAHACIGRNARRIEYFRGLLAAGQPMKIHIQVLLLDGLPIAGIINGIFLQRLYALQMVYDERYRQLAPGSAVLLMSLRKAIDARYDCVNMLSGFAYYKSRWLAEQVETRIAQIYRIGSVLYWRRMVGDWKRRVFSSGSAAAPARFNAARRGITENDDAGAVALRASIPAEGTHVAALIAEVRRCQGEFLSRAELAVAMPFDL
jgi:CelD/BcsL family acetyltransferase involved in cellulose biosynthesis